MSLADAIRVRDHTAQKIETIEGHAEEIGLVTCPQCGVHLREAHGTFLLETIDESEIERQRVESQALLEKLENRIGRA